MIARALLGEEKMNLVDTSRISEVAKAAARKSSFVADVVRSKNGVVYYGGAKDVKKMRWRCPATTSSLIRRMKFFMNSLVIQKHRFTIPTELDALLKTKQVAVPWKANSEWHELTLVTEGDEMRLSLDGKLITSHHSEGFAHPVKRWFSFLVPSTV